MSGPNKVIDIVSMEKRVTSLEQRMAAVEASGPAAPATPGFWSRFSSAVGPWLPMVGRIVPWLATFVLGGTLAFTKVNCEKTPPGPPPQPVDPDNPKPKPDPVSAYEKSLKELWQREFDPKKVEQAQNMANLHRLTAAEAKDTANTKTGDIYEFMTRKAFALGVNGKLLAITKEGVSPEWKKRLPEDTDLPLTPELRDKLAAFMNETAGILEKLQ